jgi:hypothetical protein
LDYKQLTLRENLYKATLDQNVVEMTGYQGRVEFCRPFAPLLEEGA